MGKASGRVFGYRRVSTAEQVSGFGLEAQAKAIRDYCKANGLRLVRLYEDAGISGSNGLDSRQGLAEGLAAIERGEVGGLIVYRLDRLARDLLLQETIMARMHAAGAEVISVAEPEIDSDDPTRRLVRQVVGAIAEYEKAVIRGRMMAGKAAKARQGGYTGGRPPFGWRAEGRQLVPDPAEQEVISHAHRLHEHGLSSRQIAARLNEDGHSTKDGRSWSSVQVLNVLKR